MQPFLVPAVNAGGPDHRRATSFPVTSAINPPLLMSARTLNGGEVPFPMKFSMFVPLRNTPVNPCRFSILRVVFLPFVFRVHLALGEK